MSWAACVNTIALVCLASAQLRGAEPFPARCATYYAHVFRIPCELVNAVITVESGWSPQAVSPVGAAGLMQLMPDTARQLGVRNRFDVEDNIRGGTRYLAWLVRLFDGDLRLATAAYFAGHTPILRSGLSDSSPEVYRYVRSVARVYRVYRARRQGGCDIEFRPAQEK